eukprot:TRINITY_DN4802_c0_g1_i1.p1 TRINITY_DN4802_c0_g1~~TRINITY_DN4802_c0_g1_i1.p1  ORF type:complete len:535 (-),score=133.16 TRINITY_DN4802_c0_g1_i1:78-1682(-)
MQYADLVKQLPSNTVCVCVRGDDGFMIRGKDPDLCLLAVQAVKDGIVPPWSKGIRREKWKKKGYYIKLKDFAPWSDATWRREYKPEGILCQVLRQLGEKGFVFRERIDTIDLDSEYLRSKVLFRYDAKTIGKFGDVFCMRYRSFKTSNCDALQLINASDDVIQLIRNVIHATWSRGIEREDEVSKIRVHVFVLKGSAWSPENATDTIASKTMMACLMSALDRVGHRKIGDGKAIFGTFSILYEHCTKEVDPASIDLPVGFPSDLVCISPGLSTGLVITASDDRLVTSIPLIQRAFQRMDTIEPPHGHEDIYGYTIDTPPNIWTDRLRKSRFCRMMEEMSWSGYKLVEAAWHHNGTRGWYNLFFQFSQDLLDPSREMHMPIFCMTINPRRGTIKLWEAPDSIIHQTRDAIESCWPDGIAKETMPDKGRIQVSHKFNFHVSYLKKKTFRVSMILASIFHAIEEAGCHQYGPRFFEVGGESYSIFYQKPNDVAHDDTSAIFLSTGSIEKNLETHRESTSTDQSDEGDYSKMGLLIDV